MEDPFDGKRSATFCHKAAVISSRTMEKGILKQVSVFFARLNAGLRQRFLE
jgi:hypothetical protein